MATRQYIGARYIPVFADPVEWDATRAYECLTMVQHVGDTYMSKQSVPVGAPLPDIGHGEESTEYWVHMSNWNAQVESYRQEVLAYNGRISTLEDDLPIAEFDSTNTVKKYVDDEIADVEALMPATEFDSTNTVKKYIDDEIADVEALMPATEFNSTNTVKKYVDDEIADVEAAVTNVNNKYLLRTIDDGHVIAIGDSITAGYGLDNVSDRWFGKLCSANNWTGHNFAVSGTGFSTSPNFLNQAQSAAADSSFDDDDVKYVFVFGGINDTSASGQELASAVNALQTYLESTFENAQIVYALGVCAATPVNSITAGAAGKTDRYSRIKNLNNAVQVHPKAYILPNAHLWLQGNSNYAQDTVHPNALGNTVIAEIVNSYLHGCSAVNNQIVIAETTNADVDDVSVTGYANDDIIIIDGDITFKSGDVSITSGTTLFTFPNTMMNTTAVKYIDAFSNTDTVQDQVKMSIGMQTDSSAVIAIGNKTITSDQRHTLHIHGCWIRGI